MRRARVAILLRAALVLPLIATLGLPGSFSVVVCRFGAMASGHGCCAKRRQVERPTAQMAGDGCCSMRAGDLGRPLAEQRTGADVSPTPMPAPAWTVSLASPPVRPSSAIDRPAARAVGPPLRLLKQSFLI